MCQHLAPSAASDKDLGTHMWRHKLHPRETGLTPPHPSEHLEDRKITPVTTAVLVVDDDAIQLRRTSINLRAFNLFCHRQQPWRAATIQKPFTSLASVNSRQHHQRLPEGHSVLAGERLDWSYPVDHTGQAVLLEVHCRTAAITGFIVHSAIFAAYRYHFISSALLRTYGSVRKLELKEALNEPEAEIQQPQNTDDHFSTPVLDTFQQQQHSSAAASVCRCSVTGCTPVTASEEDGACAEWIAARVEPPWSMPPAILASHMYLKATTSAKVQTVYCRSLEVTFSLGFIIPKLLTCQSAGKVPNNSTAQGKSFSTFKHTFSIVSRVLKDEGTGNPHIVLCSGIQMKVLRKIINMKIGENCTAKQRPTKDKLCTLTMAVRLTCSPPTKMNRVQYSARSLLDFRRWELCWMMPLVNEFSRGTTIFPALSFRRCSILTSIALIGSHDIAVKIRPITSLTLSCSSLALTTGVMSDCIMRSKVSMEHHQNARVVEMGDHRENPLTSCIVWHDSYM
ncbi:hypothetical protein PR048_013380 [Dryococelus australis]|uniref:Uncharacterized protein n=1 Tax=Dryococelus australis TaxID=614101 RepID=A0ABQ9HSB3_9NEOP|nr:hypothetical protein PR048_013380 [Dryococelus australis]